MVCMSKDHAISFPLPTPPMLWSVGPWTPSLLFWTSFSSPGSYGLKAGYCFQTHPPHFCGPTVAWLGLPADLDGAWALSIVWGPIRDRSRKSTGAVKTQRSSASYMGWWVHKYSFYYYLNCGDRLLYFLFFCGFGKLSEGVRIWIGLWMVNYTERKLSDYFCFLLYPYVFLFVLSCLSQFTIEKKLCGIEEKT